MDNIVRIINMMPNMMMGGSHGGIPFVGASGEKSGPDVELDKNIEIQAYLDSVIRWLQSTAIL